MGSRMKSFCPCSVLLSDQEHFCDCVVSSTAASFVCAWTSSWRTNSGYSDLGIWHFLKNACYELWLQGKQLTYVFPKIKFLLSSEIQILGNLFPAWAWQLLGPWLSGKAVTCSSPFQHSSLWGCHTRLDADSSEIWLSSLKLGTKDICKNVKTVPLSSLTFVLENTIKKFFLNFLAASGLRCCTRAFSIWRWAGATLCCGVQASHWGGFSCCRARALGMRVSVVAAWGLSSCSVWALGRRRGLSSCGSQALECRLSSCGAWA